MTSRAQIVATIGPASAAPEVLKSMIKNQMDIARLNFAFSDVQEGAERIETIRAAARACGRPILIIADLPGPRVQLEGGHTYDAATPFALTPKDEAVLQLCAERKVEYIALSFVGSAADVEHCRAVIRKHNGTPWPGRQKIIAKIERKAAVEAIDGIIAAADAVMVARGDLGHEVSIEEIPFVQRTIIAKANAAGKPVITATQMLLSMTEHREPTRAEVADVEEAIEEGSDAVMLSEETASGKFPAEAVAMMERILVAAEAHRSTPARTLHPL